MQSFIYEKKHRLSQDLYRGLIRVTFTVCVKNNADLFADPEIVDIFLGYLKISNIKNKIKNYCYVFMPNHIHILNEGVSTSSDLLAGMRLFKQYCGYWLSCNKEAYAMQKDYYDYIHRKDEDLLVHIRYLLDNPVRKGLVNRWQDYKFCGSLDYKLEELLS